MASAISPCLKIHRPHVLAQSHWPSKKTHDPGHEENVPREASPSAEGPSPAARDPASFGEAEEAKAI